MTHLNENEDWRFNKEHWQNKLKEYNDEQLQKDLIHHTNYVLNSPVTHLIIQEIKNRKRLNSMS